MLDLVFKLIRLGLLIILAMGLHYTAVDLKNIRDIEELERKAIDAGD